MQHTTHVTHSFAMRVNL